MSDSGISKAASLQRITAAERERAIKRLLAVKVCDVACGSGHLLLSASRRIALEIARLYSGEEQPNPVAMRQAMRLAIKSCIYGVDKNPLAIELCKVALWLEAHNPGEPLNFLDQHIKCGDSIVGLAFKEELESGISNEAFKALPRDDKEIAKRYRESNAKNTGSFGQLGLFDDNVSKSLSELMKQFELFDRMPETTSVQVAEKEKKYRILEKSAEKQRLKSLADIKTAQFFVPKTAENEKYLVANKQYSGYLRGGRIPAELELIDIFFTKKNFFHWFLEFPEIFARGGFDCILGNPPFLGGQKLSGSLGIDYLEYLKYAYQPIGAVDLVTYFFRRIFNLLRPDGFQSLVSTNTIAQGSAREDGLDFICSHGGTINHAIRSMRWPGEANVEVSLVTIRKGKWEKDIILNRKKVERITPYLDDSEVLGNPYPLRQNMGKSFQGSIVLGKGFVVTTEQAQALIAKDPRNGDVLFPYLNGEDLNSDPEQKPSRWVINFFGWSEEKARTYPDCFEIVERLVKPERLEKNDKAGREKWWQFLRVRKEMYDAISKVDQVMVVARISKTLAMNFIERNTVFADALVVFSNGSIISFSIMQSSIHNLWAWKYCTTMKTDLNYTPGNVFETFPFPQIKSIENEIELENIGKEYYNFRKEIMITFEFGLTKLYNLFHASQLQLISENDYNIDTKSFEKKYGREVFLLRKHLQKTNKAMNYNDLIEKIFCLRALHKKMDCIVLNAYQWSDIDLQHDFYEMDYLPENDRTHYTIHPNARKEILKRLLQLNHQIYAEEQLVPKAIKSNKKPDPEIFHNDLF